MRGLCHFFRNDIPLQFIRINNVLKSHVLFAEEDFAGNGDNSVLYSPVSGRGKKYLVQMEKVNWILADSIINLSFLLPEVEVSLHRHDECRGMFNFFACAEAVSSASWVCLVYSSWHVHHLAHN